MFALSAYRQLWAGCVLLALGNFAERLAISWLVFVETGSILAAASTLAVRSGASAIAAPFAGAFADRIPRGRLLLMTSVFKAAVMVATGFIAAGGISSQWPILAMVALMGAAQAFEVPSTQAMVTDIVGRQRAMPALSMQSVGTRLVGVLGALMGGIVSDRLGAPPALYIAAGLFVMGGLVLSGVRLPAKEAAFAAAGGIVRQTFDGIRTLTRTQSVAILLVIAMVVEIFGFAYQAVLPALAGDVLKLKATGYGVLTVAAACGGVAGVLALAALGDYKRKGAVVLVVIFVFGLGMVGLSSSELLPVSLVFIGVMGACMATVEALQWTLLQAHVPDEMRGRAVAAWVFAIGFGWTGHLAMGFAAEQFGVRWTLTGTGVALLISGVTATLLFRRASIR